MRFEETTGVSHLLRLADHAMKRSMDQALAKKGLTAAQYMVLAAIEFRGPATNAEVARECRVTPQTVNRLIEGLVESGLVTRAADPAHGRKVALSLTKKAVTLVCGAHTAVNQIELRTLAGLSKAQVRLLQESLRAAIKRLDGDD